MTIIVLSLVLGLVSGELTGYVHHLYTKLYSVCQIHPVSLHHPIYPSHTIELLCRQLSTFADAISADLCGENRLLCWVTALLGYGREGLYLVNDANPDNVQMPDMAQMIVVDKNGLQGTIVQDEMSSSFRQNSSRHKSAHPTDLLVRFENGQTLLVPTDLLVLGSEGKYHLPVAVQELSAGSAANVASEVNHAIADATVIPVVREEISVQKQLRETGVVEIRKTTHERTETVNPPLASQEVEIERIAVNRVVQEPIPVRYEGDTMIISLLEEVLVVEKRLLLREEVHIKKLNREVFDPQEVLLREERVEITRRPADHAG